MPTVGFLVTCICPPLLDTGGLMRSAGADRRLTALAAFASHAARHGVVGDPPLAVQIGY
jgi:hypothetical protein